MYAEKKNKVLDVSREISSYHNSYNNNESYSDDSEEEHGRGAFLMFLIFLFIAGILAYYYGP